MPKEKGKAHHSERKHMQGPYAKPEDGPPNSSADGGGGGSAGESEWEDVTCPVCMETPHNAVLLYCSSYQRGCRAYICDTSHRHSNCLDQYCKAQASCDEGCADGQGRPENGRGMASSSVSSGGDDNKEEELNDEAELSQGHRRRFSGDAQNLSPGHRRRFSGNAQILSSGLICPLCRGRVQGWGAVRKARQYLDKKARICASDSCSFAGSYEELRAHARREHPSARPSEMDPVRVRRWRRLQQQQDMGDVWSIISSAMRRLETADDDHHAMDEEEAPRGDYAGEAEHTTDVTRNGASQGDDDDDGDGDDDDDGHLLTVFLLLQVSWRGAWRRSRGSTRARRGLWGEIIHHHSQENDSRSPSPSQSPPS